MAFKIKQYFFFFLICYIPRNHLHGYLVQPFGAGNWVCRASLKTYQDKEHAPCLHRGSVQLRLWLSCRTEPFELLGWTKLSTNTSMLVMWTLVINLLNEWSLSKLSTVRRDLHYRITFPNLNSCHFESNFNICIPGRYCNTMRTQTRS